MRQVNAAVDGADHDAGLESKQNFFKTFSGMFPLSLTDIQKMAESAGFHLLGIRPPTPPVHFPAFISWIDQGLHAGMEWAGKPHSIRLRADPALLFPGCRSLISLAIPYPPPPVEESRTGCGRISAYARVRDYHLVLPPLLKLLGREIAAAAGKPARLKVFVDSSPIMERDLASISGKGWIGKNTCLITKQQGSFLLLAEILLDIDLPYSEASIIDHCGTCRRCMDACPTGCIRPDRLIDARKCVSYLTIEHKGVIPTELRSLIGDRVFGCDICQAVCPWNHKPAHPCVSSILQPALESVFLDLAYELSLSEDEFNRRYAGLPILRSGWENHLRNVIICAGNSRLEEFFPDLDGILCHHPSAVLRIHAAWSIGRLQIDQATIALENAMMHEKNSEVQTEIRLALEK